ncbi:MAG: RluA family pseudouridine synthase [Clostridia bacterium]|nr:RluA family pseudouridine synthase [Clostridia bacterium]
MEENIVTIIPEESGRIDKVLHIDGMSRSAIQNLIEKGNVSVNGKVISKSYKAKSGEEIAVILPELVEADILPEDIPLDIRYEDSALLVVNKPKGMVVHPAPGHYSGTLVNALMHYCGDSLSGINGVIRPGIVHRIDKDTSGLLIVAKNDAAHQGLAEQIKEHSFDRQYRAIVYGAYKEDAGTIDLPIGRSPKDRKKMAVILSGANARNAVTHYETIEKLGGFSYMKFILETGRTHQIRVHSAYMNHPIAGDPLYGPSKVITELEGQCLHAGYIKFIHPVTGKIIELEAELPEYFEKYLTKLRNKSNI